MHFGRIFLFFFRNEKSVLPLWKQKQDCFCFHVSRFCFCSGSTSFCVWWRKINCFDTCVFFTFVGYLRSLFPFLCFTLVSKVFLAVSDSYFWQLEKNQCWQIVESQFLPKFEKCPQIRVFYFIFFSKKSSI